MVRCGMAAGLALGLGSAARLASAQDAVGASSPASHYDMGASSPSWQFDMAGSDAAITVRIVHQLAAEGNAGRGIAVATQGGVVTLSGQAASAEARVRAIAVAERTTGVKSITNDVRVPGERR